MFSIQRTVPPLVVHLVVVEHGDALAVFLKDVFRYQDLVKMIELAELGELCFNQQLPQFASLGTNRVGVVLADFNRDVLDLRRCLHQSPKNRDRHQLLCYGF